jgi:hypothetical protein
MTTPSVANTAASNPSPFSRTADRVSASLDRHFKLLSAILILVLLVWAIHVDLRQKMWVDELYTLHMATQPTLADIVHATIEGADGAPPLYSMIVHMIHPWIASDALAVCLPSTLGFLGMLICLLAFCRKRLAALYAFIAASLIFNSAIFYLTEGRCYGLVFFAAAGALLAWQAALDLRYTNSDTAGLLMSALAHRSTLRIVPYDSVLRDHPRFLLAASASDYLPAHLATAGYRLRPLGVSHLLYEVVAPGI